MTILYTGYTVPVGTNGDAMRMTTRARSFIAALLGLGLCTAGLAAAPMYDIVIKGGQIYDGTGSPAYIGDVGIRGDRIAYIGKPRTSSATRRTSAHATPGPGSRSMRSSSG